MHNDICISLELISNLSIVTIYFGCVLYLNLAILRQVNVKVLGTLCIDSQMDINIKEPLKNRQKLLNAIDIYNALIYSIYIILYIVYIVYIIYIYIYIYSNQG